MDRCDEQSKQNANAYEGVMSLKNVNPKCSFVDLFAGPGGLSLGFKMSGFFEPIAAVESNPEAAETYRNNFGVQVLEEDVGKVHPLELLRLAREKGYEAIDAVIGGPPCRPFTTANTGGTRWKKIREQHKSIIENGDFEQPDWLSFWQIIAGLDPQPRIVVAENVTGLKNHDDVFSKFLDRLSKTYTTCYRELHATHFGVPQNRKRIFITGIRCFSGDCDDILPHNPQVRRANIVNVRKAISDLPDLSNNQPGSRLSRYRKCKPTHYQSMLRDGSHVLYDHIAHSVHPVMAERFQYIPQGFNLRKAWKNGKIPEASMHSHYFKGSARKQFSESTLENMHNNIYRRLIWEDESLTITHVRKTVLIHPLQDRLLSIREAARLQSFPDWFRFSGSISQQYQQIADAVPPFLAQAIAKHLAMQLIKMPKPSSLQIV